MMSEILKQRIKMDKVMDELRKLKTEEGKKPLGSNISVASCVT